MLVLIINVYIFVIINTKYLKSILLSTRGSESIRVCRCVRGGVRACVTGSGAPPALYGVTSHPYCSATQETIDTRAL